MINYLHDQYRIHKSVKLIIWLFLLFSVWWLAIYFRFLTDDLENHLFTTTYGLIALIGGISGVFISQRWGGYKSILGKTITFLSAGLLFQFLGQVSYIIYIYILGVEVPYPSFGDIIFVVSNIFYIIGAYNLILISGVKLTVDNIYKKIIVLIIPIILLTVSYIVFLYGYSPDWHNIPVILLDFGYPMLQAIYVSLALIALVFSKNVLGGIMKTPIVLLIWALIAQYFADFVFSYQVSRETWYVGGTNDYLYFLAYFLMTLSLLSIGNMFYKVQKS